MQNKVAEIRKVVILTLPMIYMTFPGPMNILPLPTALKALRIATLFSFACCKVAVRNQS